MSPLLLLSRAGEQQLPPTRLPARRCRVEGSAQTRRCCCFPSSLTLTHRTWTGASPKASAGGTGLSSTPSQAALVVVCRAKEEGGGLLSVHPGAQPHPCTFALLHCAAFPIAFLIHTPAPSLPGNAALTASFEASAVKVWLLLLPLPRHLQHCLL